MPDNTVPIESQSPSQLELAECDFRGIAGLAKLKVCINYEYHREAAIEGHQPAFAWLEKEYPCWRVKPIKDVPPHLVKERIERLKQKELLAAANQLLLSPNEIPANDQAFAAGRPLPPLPVNITD